MAVDGARYGDGGYGEAPYELASFGQSWRERAFLDQARYTEPRYEQDPYGEGFYGDGPHQEAPYGQAFYDQARYHQPQYGQVRYDQAGQVRYDQAGQVRYHQAQYGQVRYHQAQYGQDRHGQDRHGQDRHSQDPYGQDPYEQDPYEETRFDEVRSDEAPRTTYERPVPARRKPGAHRHARPSRKRRRPVRLAAAMAGSGLLVAGAVPVAAHWWHRPATHPDADQASLPATPGAASGLSATSHNALDQWAQIPIGKHVAAEAKVAQRARRRAAEHPAPQPSHSPQPAATVSSAYQNPLRAVSDLVLERVDMGVDFGGAGPVYALGDGVITNATDNSSGWPGGGWITYQLTGGPDAGLVVYLAEDVTPSVQVGQKVTSSTVIANMFNGGDGIETGWATSDGSTAESQMAAAGGISGGGPFPTMVGLSFDAVLESVGVPAAPNADQAGSGLLPAGYPPVAG
ncbi:MAG TPA: hypothetical protein VMC83_40965 [Streptosporangiaceae bacterium]|nr:hypothetical protein [Streptosporangiaceae bacterium]